MLRWLVEPEDLLGVYCGLLRLKSGLGLGLGLGTLALFRLLGAGLCGDCCALRPRLLLDVDAGAFFRGEECVAAQGLVPHDGC